MANNNEKKFYTHIYAHRVIDEKRQQKGYPSTYVAACIGPETLWNPTVSETVNGKRVINARISLQNRSKVINDLFGVNLGVNDKGEDKHSIQCSFWFSSDPSRKSAGDRLAKLLDDNPGKLLRVLVDGEITINETDNGIFLNMPMVEDFQFIGAVEQKGGQQNSGNQKGSFSQTGNSFGSAQNGSFGQNSGNFGRNTGNFNGQSFQSGQRNSFTQGGNGGQFGQPAPQQGYSAPQNGQQSYPAQNRQGNFNGQNGGQYGQPAPQQGYSAPQNGQQSYPAQNRQGNFNGQNGGQYGQPAPQQSYQNPGNQNASPAPNHGMNHGFQTIGDDDGNLPF